MKYTGKLPENNDNVSEVSPLREFFILTGGLLGIVVGIYFALGLFVDILAPRISPELEMKMARAFLKQVDGEDSRSSAEHYLQGIVDSMGDRCADLPYRFRVHVSESDIINAVAFPGGHIVVYRGLLDRLSSENETAFVLAHEMGHYAHRDHLRGMGRGLVFMAVSSVLFGADSGVNDLLSQVLGLTEMNFSRSQESAADSFGLSAVNCAYGHVSGATDFFSKIPPEQDSGALTKYFASHPETGDRVRDLQEMARQKGFPEGELISLPSGFKSGK